MNGIALFEKMGSGKSTTAKELFNHFKSVDTANYPVIYSFGTGVKRCAKEYFDTESPQKKDRDLLINIGMGMRNIRKDVWIEYLSRAMIKDSKRCSHLKLKHIPIVDDLRFVNEYDFLKENNFTIVKVSVTPLVQEFRLREMYPLDWEKHKYYTSHISENLNREYNVEINSENPIETNIESIKKYLGY